MAAKASRKKKSIKSVKKGKQNNVIREEIVVLVVLAVSILLILSSFGIGGKAGRLLSDILFGVFGKVAYVFPFLLFIGVCFLVSNKKNIAAKIKAAAGLVLLVLICTFLQMATVAYKSGVSLPVYYQYSSQTKKAGGIIGGAITKVLCPAFGTAGTYVIIVILIIICLVLITERSFLGSLRRGGKKVYESAKDDAAKLKIRNAERKEERRSEKKASGVSMDTALPKKKKTNAKMKEITMPEPDPVVPEPEKAAPLHINRSEPLEEEVIPEPEAEEVKKPARKTKESANEVKKETDDISQEIKSSQPAAAQEYRFPPMSLLKKGARKALGDSDQQLRETAGKLEQTLHNFGVAVTVTNVSCGPSVTRYELQPEQGVKVSRIVNLADDIKLNLAAPDIRIEAPIPGKAAVGIEVPNRENSTVMLRDLLESQEFTKHPSNIAFAAGRDIGGQIVVTDIMKMPHLLIAGATGSGKSVCINTLIMSILYKASPEDVKLIMIDPKVVELSVYNGIPHLFIPVVTDPKKAAGALHWAVAEMTDRYQKFADLNVRDLKGYNAKIAAIDDMEDEEKPEKLPQIVIIVDELADLMMVAPGEVEDAICRLAQLARAAGIHLILATQRPSVNVITGLIKANMPSRIAFSVSSGVDSRTIIDMNGAEKLLGKGDMLFYPSGYQKPVRVQGAFVSDKEVAAVVDYLLKKNGNVVYNHEIEQQVVKAQTADSGAGGGDERDVYFTDAGKFIIEKDKASIGMLQRVFKIGFNRAARIMDQLAEAGVVGPEEGTKPRKVLMSMEEFEQFIEEYV